jgi:nifR3 family TIM-barrel protein
MAGYTDSAFKQLIKEIAPPVICMTELISSDAMAYNSKKTLAMLKFSESERPNILQLFGKKLEHFATAAKMAEDLGFDGVDINLGCPARKVINSMHGSALIKDPELAARIVETVAKNTRLPVSVKTRLGWSDDSALDDFTRDLENAGAQMITIHGRTAKQVFTGVADWEPIYKIKLKRGVPITGNGDIRSGEDAKKKIRNLDGVMVGRATVTNPWVMSEICAALGLMKQKDVTKKPDNFQDLKKFIIKHCRYTVDVHGEKKGMLEMRKYLANYIRDFPDAAKFRAELVRVETLEEAQKILDRLI